MTLSHELIIHLFMETNVKNLKAVLGIVTTVATLTLGLASAQATPATVAIKDLKLVAEKSSDKPAAFNAGHGYYGGHHGGHGYYGGHHGGHGYYGGGHGYYGGRGGHGYYGGHHGGHGYYGGRGGRWMTPAGASVSPKVSL